MQITLTEVPDDFNENPINLAPTVVTGEGTFTNTSFAPDNHDVGVAFYLTATESIDGSGNPISPALTAQTSFTDSTHIQSVTVGTQTPSPVVAGNSATYLVTIHFNGSGTCTADLSLATTSLPSGATPSFSPTQVTGGTSGNTERLLHANYHYDQHDPCRHNESRDDKSSWYGWGLPRRRQPGQHHSRCRGPGCHHDNYRILRKSLHLWAVCDVHGKCYGNQRDSTGRRHGDLQGRANDAWHWNGERIASGDVYDHFVIRGGKPPQRHRSVCGRSRLPRKHLNTVIPSGESRLPDSHWHPGK